MVVAAVETLIREAPDSPGVYRFRDSRNKAIYIGKARDLRKRLMSYLRSDGLAERTLTMLGKARDLSYTVTKTEVEAFILENTLIKELRPRFNVLLRDDKTYPYIRVTTSEDWPKVELTRKVRKDGNAYYGPFMGQRLARRVMELARTRFQVRTCKITIDGRLDRPCLYHSMGACLGPCVDGLTSPEAYRGAVDELGLFLSGKHRELIDRLESSMWRAAEREDYEGAAGMRDLVAAVKRLSEQQEVEQPGAGDVDVFALASDGHNASLCVLPYRRGKLVDKREVHFEGVGEIGLDELLATLVGQYYQVNPAVPPELELAQPLAGEEIALLEAALGAQRGSKVRLLVPRRGRRARRVQLASTNARAAFDIRFRAPLKQAGHLARRLGEALELSGPVAHAECFDVSHAQGKQTVASCVVWTGGRMDRRRYRSFTIKSVEGIDDFASIAEAVGRRYRRLRDEGQAMPDLVLIDGGLGQLNSARAAIDALGLDLDLASLAKREELIFLPDRDEPLRLDSSDPAHLVLRQMRDEAHRFAVAKHRSRRRKATLATELLGIPGVGAGRAQKLIKTFGSVRGVQQASEAELMAAVGPKLGHHVFQHLHAGEAK